MVVSEATSLGLRPATWLVAGGGLVALLAAGFSLARRSRSRRPAEAAGDPTGYPELRGRLDSARKRRLEGDLKGAVLVLARIERDLGVESEVESAALDKLIEGARYGGYVPAREELDTIERRVARRVREMEEDPRQAAREALRLRNQES